jgi:hypothetical protein
MYGMSEVLKILLNRFARHDDTVDDLLFVSQLFLPRLDLAGDFLKPDDSLRNT